MPRPQRSSLAGSVYHVLNRGNGMQTVFEDADDYRCFTELLGAACERRPMGVLAWCLMPNHFHLVVQPPADGDLSVWMQWLATSHVRRYHRRHEGGGHVWQGRYKSFPVQDDGHQLAVIRYVERNALRSGLVPRAEDWLWSSLAPWPDPLSQYRVEPDPPRTADWLKWVNAPQDDAEEASLRLALKRGQPFGETGWQRQAAQRHGLESSLRAVGRPRKDAGPTEA